MDQYVSWGLSSEELNLDTIWGKYEEFCKPQANEVRAQFYLLTSFCQGNCSVDEWYTVLQAQINLARYPPERAKIWHKDIFRFFLHDEEFVSQTINDGNMDLDKFPASKVRHFVKRMESSKATACHIKQVVGYTQPAQINHLRHQHTELPAEKYKKKKSSNKSRQSNYKNPNNENSQVPSQHRKQFAVKIATRAKNGVQSVEIPTMQKAFNALQRNVSVRLATSLGTLPAFATRRRKLHINQRSQNHTKYKGQNM